MAKIVSVEQMRAIEQAADSAGLSYDQMMINAGRAVAEAVLNRLPVPAGSRVAILAGSGNNGGDGLVAGDVLAEAGAQVSVYLVKPRPSPDPHLDTLRARGLLVAEAEQDQRSRRSDKHALHGGCGARCSFRDRIETAVEGTGEDGSGDGQQGDR